MADTVLRIRYEPADSLPEIGVDEAGRGSFWGPLMAAAVCLPSDDTWTPEQRLLFSQIRDSKKISAKKRAALYRDILQYVPLCAVGYVAAEEINAHGIQWANKEAFRRAVRGLKEKVNAGDANAVDAKAVDANAVDAKAVENTKYRVIIDGMLSLHHQDPREAEETEREFSTDEYRLVIDGDDRYLTVATASIVAKVAHDEWIQAYCEEHTDCAERYDLVRCKGYGTARHREAIQRYGGHELHRVVYIQYWLPGSTVSRLKRTASRKKTAIDENAPLFQFD